MRSYGPAGHGLAYRRRAQEAARPMFVAGSREATKVEEFAVRS